MPRLQPIAQSWARRWREHVIAAGTFSLLVGIAIMRPGPLAASAKSSPFPAPEEKFQLTTEPPRPQSGSAATPQASTPAKPGRNTSDPALDHADAKERR